MKLISQEFTALARKLEEGARQARTQKHSRLTTPVAEQDLRKLKAQLAKGELILPDDTLQSVVRATVERDFLNESPQDTKFPVPPFQKEQGWVRISRLPVSPVENKSHALFPKWQNSIAAMHTLKLRLCYVLLRQDGETSLYLGAIPITRSKKGGDARKQLMQSVSSQMPGIGLDPVSPAELSELSNLTCCGAVTGLPSIRNMTEYGEYQTMDQLVMGLRDDQGNEQNFALVVVADPVPDHQILQIQQTMANLSTEIYSIAQYTRTDGVSASDNVMLSNSDGSNSGMHVGVGAGKNAGIGFQLGELLRADMGISGSVNGGVNWGRFLSSTCSQGSSVGTTGSLSRQYLNKAAMDCKELLDKHMERMKDGRSMGFWKTGAYVLAESQLNVETVMGMLRAAYSGDNTYMEPIRTTTLGVASGADTVVRLFHHLPNASPSVAAVLGELFQDYATPMTTQELSIAISLPTRDVPGLRLIRNAVHFTANPPGISEAGQKLVNLGKILDAGASTHQNYRFPLNQMRGHVLIAGTTNGGKSTTCKVILDAARKGDVPFLVIEPVKEEFMTWALDQNRKSGKRKILVFAPGSDDIKGVSTLKLNPFQPAAVKGGRIDMSLHLSRLTAALLSTMPMQDDIIPTLLRKTLNLHVRDNLYVDLVKGRQLPNGKLSHSPTDGIYLDNEKIQYPYLRDMVETPKKALANLYAEESKTNLVSALTTRIEKITDDWKKDAFMSVPRSMDFAELFEKNDVVINLNSLEDDDKAFVMSLILTALWEYRESRYKTDAAYRAAADRGELQHLTLVDEAHKLLSRFGSNSQLHAARTFANMLKEVRAYGQGLLISDQVPAELISDAIDNTNLKIVHRLNSDGNMKLVADGMRLRPDQTAVIGALQPGEAIVCGSFDDAAAWIKVHPQ
ncbi:MAG: ATP-binding protein [Oscillospiraceae bacterium]|nr:ATP-binding protein [Oscillospiraceae bacterium]